MEKDSKEIEKRTLSFPLQGSAMFFFLHRKHGFVPYVKKYKKTLDENTILVYYTTMTVMQKER